MGQALTDWGGDVPSLLAEMKRRAGVRTDLELARFMGAAQSTVSNWRKRDAIPESAILQFEAALNDPYGNNTKREMAARAIALRVPELWFLRMQDTVAARWIAYQAVAMSLNGIIAEISKQLRDIEVRSGVEASTLLPQLLEDDRFLGGIVDWVSGLSLDEALAREIEASRRRAP